MWVGIESERTARQRFDELFAIACSGQRREMRASIPKCLHFVWLGSTSLVTFGSENIKKWSSQLGPEWQLKLWTDCEVDPLVPEFGDVVLRTYGGMTVAKKADVARLMILTKFGGFYLDVDYVFCRPLDVLAAVDADFICCESNVSSSGLEINNGFIAAAPGHPLLRRMIDAATSDHSDEAALCRITRDPVSDVIASTGPGMFTRQVIGYLNDNPPPSILVLPYQFFHAAPNTASEAEKRSWLTASVRLGRFDVPLGVHWWLKSWTEEARRDARRMVLSQRDIVALARICTKDK